MAVVAEVFFGGELFVERGGLEDDGDLGADLIRIAGEFEVEDANGAVLRRDQRGEDAEEGGFAGAIGAEEGEDFAGVDVEGEIGEGGALAVGMGEVGDGDGGRQGVVVASSQ